MSRAGPVMHLARDERAELVNLLATLTPEQWNAPSLCTRWRVRDVVAHVFSYEELGPVGVVGVFLRGGLLPSRVNAIRVAAYADRSTDDLIAFASEHLEPKGVTAGFGGRVALTDGMIHHQDIRRPLGLPRAIPPDRMIATLDFARTSPTLGARKRVRGLTLSATDLDWSTGEGPTVEGPAEALLMAIAGRGVAGELVGPGQPTLARRIGG
jgi:uncharacterized protein (TIGR03083 family)